MTPPDSGAYPTPTGPRCALCGQFRDMHTTEGWCDYQMVPGDKPGKFTKPDPGEREVMCVCGEDPVAMDGLCRECWLGLCGCTEDMHPRRVWDISDASVAKLIPEGKTPVVLPLPLAQRILAALEESYSGGFLPSSRIAALAAELRAIVERKP